MDPSSDSDAPRRLPLDGRERAMELKALARELGFHRARVAMLRRRGPGILAFDRFVAEGRHGEMAWLPRGREARADPRTLLPGAKSALVLGIDYAWPRPPDPGGLTGKVASYAWGRDYHNLVGKRLQKLVKRIRALGLDAYAGVDSRPLLERAWAEESGLAFLGKSCLAIVPGETSYLFLAVVLLTVPLPPDAPKATALRHCGSCTRCLDVCPTQAFTGPGELDARRCISYLTIEHRSPVPEALHAAFGRWVFGCDDCQEICPHNAVLHGSPEPDLAPRPGHAWLDLDWVMRTEDAKLEAHFQGSPVRRARATGLKRNAAIVLANLGLPEARRPLLVGLEHGSPLVSETCRHSLRRLDGEA